MRAIPAVLVPCAVEVIDNAPVESLAQDTSPRIRAAPLSKAAPLKSRGADPPPAEPAIEPSASLSGEISIELCGSLWVRVTLDAELKRWVRIERLHEGGEG